MVQMVQGERCRKRERGGKMVQKIQMADDFSFKLLEQDNSARLGVVSMPRGEIRTPAFMPVGTAGTVKAMYMSQVREAGADIILGNTYHLMLRPGAERVAKLGGLHEFIKWQQPILTDSGGFQVMSLSKLARLSEHGVIFNSHIDGKRYDMSPERSIEIQTLLGSDIQMQLDQCVRLPATYKQLEEAMELSLRWAQRSKQAFGTQPGKAMFGIVQGGDNISLREKSALALKAMDLRGYSIGGLAVGEPQEIMLDMITVVNNILPSEKPRYLMGVGTPDDILKAVAKGIDMFDCVMPTRAGRHGLAFTRFGKVNLRNARHADDARPLEEQAECPASSQYSRAYLHHLVKCNEALGAMLLSWHNISYYQRLMQDIRVAIKNRNYETFMGLTIEDWNRGDIPLI